MTSFEALSFVEASKSEKCGHANPKSNPNPSPNLAGETGLLRSFQTKTKRAKRKIEKKDSDNKNNVEK